MSHYDTRLSYNSSGWHHPTGDARKYEEKGTYNHDNGFGHEDWLLRQDFKIDGWRYAFIQGVNKSHAKLVKQRKPINLDLFTIQPDKKRHYVATIEGLECLDDSAADAALEEFKARGWHDTMEREILAVGGKVSALGDAKKAKHVLNVRFREDNVRFFPPGTFAKQNDPILKLMRYMLYDVTKVGVAAKRRSNPKPSSGSSDLPNTGLVYRRPSYATTFSPEHMKMQAKLMLELKSEYPGARILREQNFIDVSVRTASELMLFEIKSDLEPLSVIRQALGQILEYAYHPSRRHNLPVRLFIVGRNPLSQIDAEYFNRLKSEFSIPISYRVVNP